MQGISEQNRISTASAFPVAGAGTRSSDSVASSFLNCFASACNVGITRPTVHATLSSPWNNEHRGDYYPTKYFFPTSAKAFENLKRESLKAEHKKNIGKYCSNSSSYDDVLNTTGEKYRPYRYDKLNYLSR